jgi:hypothetical protein
VFKGIAHACAEYDSNFPETAMSSAFFTWVLGELGRWIDKLCIQIFASNNFKDMAQAIVVLRSHATMLQKDGLNLHFFVNDRLNPSLIELIGNGFARVEEVMRFLNIPLPFFL